MLSTRVVDDQQISGNTFGLFIAYTLPGLTAIYGLPLAMTSTSGWTTILATSNPTVVDFIIIVFQATTVGLIVSSVRGLTLDALHHRTGLRPPAWNFAILDHSVAVLELLIQIHYRYYKFYANMVVALLWSLATGGWSLGWKQNVCYLLLIGLFFVASRDALRKYYERTTSLFRPNPTREVKPAWA